MNNNRLLHAVILLAALVLGAVITLSGCSGSSGGAAVNEKMQLAGITPGGFYSADGKTFKYGVLIPASEIKICLDEWDNQ